MYICSTITINILDMEMYTMSQVESLSGIKSHTLRVWEKRYDILKPERSTSNIRYYSDAEVRKLLNIKILLNNGYRISTIDKLSEKDFHTQVLDIGSKISDKFEDDVNRLIISMLELDEAVFNEIFKKNILSNGLLPTFTNLIYPFLNQIGLLWTTNKSIPSQEHFISNLIRQKIIAEIDAITILDVDAPKIIMFLSEKEDHELGLLLAYFIAKKMGMKVYYLGQNVPLNNIEKMIEMTGAKVAFSIFTSPKKEKYFINFKQNADNLDSMLLVSGNYNTDYLSNNIKYLSNPQDLIDQLELFLIKSSV